MISLVESILSKKPSINVEMNSDTIKNFIWESDAPNCVFELHRNELHITQLLGGELKININKQEAEKIKSLGVDIIKDFSHNHGSSTIELNGDINGLTFDMKNDVDVIFDNASNFTVRTEDKIEYNIRKKPQGNNITFECYRLRLFYVFNEKHDTSGLHVKTNAKRIDFPQYVLYIDRPKNASLNQVFDIETGKIANLEQKSKIQNLNPLKLLDIDFLDVINRQARIDFTIGGTRIDRQVYYFDHNTTDALVVMKGWGLHEK